MAMRARPIIVTYSSLEFVSGHMSLHMNLRWVVTQHPSGQDVRLSLVEIANTEDGDWIRCGLRKESNE